MILFFKIIFQFFSFLLQVVLFIVGVPLLIAAAVLCFLCLFFLFLLILCFGFLLLCNVVVLAFKCIAILGILAFSLSLVLVLVTRVFQMIRGGEGYKKLTQVKHVIRVWLIYTAAMILPGLGLFFPVVSFFYDLFPIVKPWVNHVMLLELPLAKWVVILIILCGLCIFNGLLYISAHILIATIFMDGGSRLVVGEAFSEIIDGLFFWWATHEVMKRVPSFQQHEILGLPTRKWIKVSVLVLIGYNVIILVTLLFVLLLRKVCRRPLQDSSGNNTLNFWQDFKKYHMHFRYAVYYLNGLRARISFIMSSLLLLLVWIFYFGSQLDMKSADTRDMWEYGKWTFISLTISSFLWLIKTAVLLAWEAHSIYDTLQNRIISTSEQLSFLSIIGSTTLHDIFEIQQKLVLSKEQEEERNRWGRRLSSIRSIISNTDWVKDPTEEREKIQKDLLQLQKLASPSMDDIQQVTQYFLRARKTLMKETYVSDILQGFDAIDDNRIKLEELFSKEETSLPGSHVDDEAQNSTMDSREDSGGANPNIQERSFHEDAVHAEIHIQIENENEAQNFTLDSREVSVGAETIVNQLEQIHENIEDDQEQSVEERSGQQISRIFHQDGEIREGDEAQNSNENQPERQQDPRSSHQDCNDTWNRFLKKLPQINSSKGSKNIPLSDLQTWAERAHSECMNLANTLSSAKEVSDCLDQIISWLLAGAVLLMWLFFTKLAITKVLVLIASQLLAVTFIFGGTCKRLFEGILFVLVVRPIDVGDLCFIDEMLVEVRSIGVWTTTFTKLDKFGMTQEPLIYPNSKLTNKAIINHKNKFDWSDRAEFKLTDVKKIYNDIEHEFMKFVEDRLTKEECSFLSNILNLTVSSTTEDSIKLIICLEYNADNIQGWTYSECLQRKYKLKGDFHVYMQHVISEFKAEQAKMPAEQAKNEASSSITCGHED